MSVLRSLVSPPPTDQRHLRGAQTQGSSNAFAERQDTPTVLCCDRCTPDYGVQRQASSVRGAAKADAVAWARQPAATKALTRLPTRPRPQRPARMPKSAIHEEGAHASAAAAAGAAAEIWTVYGSGCRKCSLWWGIAASRAHGPPGCRPTVAGWPPSACVPVRICTAPLRSETNGS